LLCPKCNSVNKDGAKFCKTCGAPLNAQKSLVHDDLAKNSPINSNKTKNSNKNILIIAVTAIICVVIVAGTFVYLNANSSSNNVVNDTGDSVNESPSDSSEENSNVKATSAVSKLSINSGSISTGSSLSAKTYCTVNVGSEHSGEKVKISVLYSRDGSNLNSAKIVSKVVDSDGNVEVVSADSFKYYPDKAIITIYDGNGNEEDTLSVTLNTKEGTQYF